jgi:hypothetical protein
VGNGGWGMGNGDSRNPVREQGVGISNWEWTGCGSERRVTWFMGRRERAVDDFGGCTR